MAVVPLRLVDRLRVLKLPAGHVDFAGPNNGYGAPEPISRDRLIANHAEPKHVDKTSLGRSAIAGRTGPPTRASLDLRRINAEQAKPCLTASKRVAVDNISAWAVDHWGTMAVSLDGSNGLSGSPSTLHRCNVPSVSPAT